MSSDTNATGAGEEWLANLDGKHRQLFDVNTVRDGTPLTRVYNYISAYEEAYGLKPPTVRVLFGAHGQGLPFVFGDALWAKYEFGERYTVNDPLTGKPTTRNPFVTRDPAYTWNADYSIRTLQGMGVRFLACNRSLRALSRALSADGRGDAAEIRDELQSGLLDGVFVVPAMVLAANRAQEVGWTYVYVG